MKLLMEGWRKYLKETIGLDENPNLSDDPDAFETAKKPIPLEFRYAEEDQTIETKEGSVNALAGAAIMTGTEGEEWPIPREKFEQTYDILEEPSDEKLGSAAKKDILVFAKEMSDSFQVKVSWSDDLLGGETGDYLVQYGEGDYGVVGREIFEKTYEPREGEATGKEAAFRDIVLNELGGVIDGVQVTFDVATDVLELLDGLDAKNKAEFLKLDVNQMVGVAAQKPQPPVKWHDLASS